MSVGGWPRAIIANVRDTTSIDRSTRAVRSVQAAEMLLPASGIAGFWPPAYLERLARTYWRFLPRVTLGLIRVRYTEKRRFVVLFFRPLTLLAFEAPEYELSATHGLVRWRIARGLLVA